MSAYDVLTFSKLLSQYNKERSQEVRLHLLKEMFRLFYYYMSPQDKKNIYQIVDEETIRIIINTGSI